MKNRLFFFGVPMLICCTWLQTNVITSVRTSVNFLSADTIPKPSVVIEEVDVDSIQCLVIRDTLSSLSDLTYRIGKHFYRMYDFLADNKMKPGRSMTFYVTDKPPFIFEAGIEIFKIPVQFDEGMHVRKLPAGHAIVAHYTGPYETINIAYETLFSWQRQHPKEKAGLMFEVYVNDPVVIKNPYQLKTDVFVMLFH